MNLILTMVGAALFGVLILYGYLYSRGAVNMPPHKAKGYRKWVKQKGQSFRRKLLIFALIYLVALAFQLYTYFS